MSVTGSQTTPSLPHVLVPTALLVMLNILLMYLVAATPLATINQYMFSIPLLGVLIYGAMIGLGEHVAKKSLKREQTGLAIAGVTLLQIAYGLFGGGVLAYAPREMQFPALIVTLGISFIVTTVLLVYVYKMDANLSHWTKWSSWAFFGGLGFALLGSFIRPVLFGAFILFFIGFILELGWEIWNVRDDFNPDAPLTHSVGIYVAFTGVFVHILQLVIRTMADQ